MSKIYLAFLWHQHQPMYKNPSTGVYELPWVRLHATKDYYDTVAILDEFPKIKANFNLVPSLLLQLEEYSNGTAKDAYLELSLKPAEDLTTDDKSFILHNFFMANWETKIFPYARYKQLLEKRGRQTSKGELNRIQTYFTPQDFRDLQVWFNLAWMDPYWQRNDEIIKNLYYKGTDFTETDKRDLINKQLQICGKIVGKYKELQDKNQIEVTTTPFYHPILPLVCDTNTARGSTPQIVLPKKRFQEPEDAKAQVQKSIEYYAKVFGRSPKGMWPSEGSVSEEVIGIIKDAGINWIATDEEILFRSIANFSGDRGALYKPYNFKDLYMLFRDNELSDAVGFVYQKWDPQAAVNDFMKRIHNLKNVYARNNDIFIPIILDGENCWEYYQNDGWDFLSLLYTTISSVSNIETVLVSEYLESNKSVPTLHKLWPGSWINANYGIWIGHKEDNTAWEFLYETRDFLKNYIKEHPEKANSEEIRNALEKIYIAEGSDWNWWYGDDHSSGNDDMFDMLFRQNLIAVYETLGEQVPNHLYKAIKGSVIKKPILEPIELITPKIDGNITSYFEWKNAGFYAVGHAGGTMHQVETILKSFHYGFDLENIYFRLDLNTYIDEDLSFRIDFILPQNMNVTLNLKRGGEVGKIILNTPQGSQELDTACAKKIIELGIPVQSLLDGQDLESFEFSIVVLKNNSEIERWPYQSTVIIPKPSKDFNEDLWNV